MFLNPLSQVVEHVHSFPKIVLCYVPGPPQSGRGIYPRFLKIVLCYFGQEVRYSYIYQDRGTHNHNTFFLELATSKNSLSGTLNKNRLQDRY